MTSFDHRKQLLPFVFAEEISLSEQKIALLKCHGGAKLASITSKLGAIVGPIMPLTIPHRHVTPVRIGQRESGSSTHPSGACSRSILSHETLIYTAFLRSTKEAFMGKTLVYERSLLAAFSTCSLGFHFFVPCQETRFGCMSWVLSASLLKSVGLPFFNHFYHF